MKLALGPQMSLATHTVRELPDGPGADERVAAIRAWERTIQIAVDLGMEPPGNAVLAAPAAVGFDGVLSSCVSGFEEDARGVSERQRDQAAALVDQHFGGDAGAALLRSTTH